MSGSGQNTCTCKDGVVAGQTTGTGKLKWPEGEQ